VELEVHDLSSGPSLVVRRNLLPLQLEETAHYLDRFAGITHEFHNQRVIIEECAVTSSSGECEQLVGPARLAQVPPGAKIRTGTLWATGSPPPGIYYIGLYNDFQLANSPIENYTLNIQVTGECSGGCEDGFGGEGCRSVCPGVSPLSHYSHSPMPRVGACSNHGSCSSGEDDSMQCTCEEGFLGPLCGVACPANEDGVCGGQGACSLNANTGLAECTCTDGFIGQGCEHSCPDACNSNGECVLHATALGGEAATCHCDPSHRGERCTLECPLAKGEICGGHGDCVVVRRHLQEDDIVACRCEAGFEGAACASAIVQVVQVAEEEAPILPEVGQGPRTTVKTKEVMPEWVVPVAVIGGSLMVLISSIAAYSCVVVRRKLRLMGYQTAGEHSKHDEDTYDHEEEDRKARELRKKRRYRASSTDVPASEHGEENADEASSLHSNIQVTEYQDGQEPSWEDTVL